MKKISAYIVIIFIIIGFAACSSNNDEEIIEIVKDIERSKHDVINLDISFREYFENIKGYLGEKYSKSDKVLFNLNNKPFTEEDMENLSEEEWNEMKHIFQPNKNIEIPRIELEPIEISKVYEDLDTGNKNVFVKERRIIEKESDKWGVLYRRYILYKEKNEWKVSDIEQAAYLEEEITDEIKKRYETFDSEPIEYIEKVDYTNDNDEKS